MMTVRLPKWLTTETFTITHDRKAPGRFTVTLYADLAQSDQRFAGYGPSIALAAKRAAALRARHLSPVTRHSPE